MRAMTSSVSLGSTSSAPMFSCTCSTRLAPVMTVDTLRVLGAPGQRQLRQRAVELVGDPRERLHLGVARLVGEDVLEPLVARQGGAAALRDAVDVLARQEARGERAPGREPEPDVLVEAGVLTLDAPPLEDVVLRLLHHGLAQVVAVGDLPRGPDLVGRPLRRAPVQGLAAVDDVRHRPHGLLDGRLRVGPVAEEEVDEVEPEALEAAVDRVQQVLAVQRVAAVHALGEAPVHLGGHHVASRAPSPAAGSPPP